MRHIWVLSLTKTLCSLTAVVILRWKRKAQANFSDLIGDPKTAE